MTARDSEKTKARILKAVGALLAKKGFEKLGINAIARAARVDKVLIYRYFGGLPQLLEAYAKQGPFWPTTSELLGERAAELLAGGDPYAISTQLLKGHVAALRARPHTQEIMRWELHQRNALTDELAVAREQQGIDLMAMLASSPAATELARGRDLPAIAAILHAGLTYLVLRAKTADVYLGVDLTSEEGWQRLTAALETLVKAVTAEPASRHEHPARP